jgi:hypothetical protein
VIGNVALIAKIRKSYLKIVNVRVRDGFTPEKNDELKNKSTPTA